MAAHRRHVLLAQLPIPPLGPAPIRGIAPLEEAGGCAAVVWRGAHEHVPEALEAHEYTWAP